MLDGIKLFGVVNGKCNNSGSESFLIVDNNSENISWYLNALEIVLETINYVLKQKDKNDYYLLWSG